MKNLIIVLVVLVLVSTFAVVVFADQDLLITQVSNEVKINIDGKELQFTDAKPYITEQNRTMVPLRAVTEGFGAKVEWRDGLIIITNAEFEVRFRVDYNEDNLAKQVGISKLNSRKYKEIETDTRPIIKNSRTFVPLRFVSQAFGYKVDWKQDDKTVLIDTREGDSVFLINPALRDEDILSSSIEEYKGIIKTIEHPLTNEQIETYINDAKSYIEDDIGNVDYTKDFNSSHAVAAEFPTAPFSIAQKVTYDDAVKNSIIREVKFVPESSNLDVLYWTEMPGLSVTEVLIKGKLQFNYHEASDVFLKKFNGHISKNTWYITDIWVKIEKLSRDITSKKTIILGNSFEKL